jgi:hypothetical protein
MRIRTQSGWERAPWRKRPCLQSASSRLWQILRRFRNSRPNSFAAISMPDRAAARLGIRCRDLPGRSRRNRRASDRGGAPVKAFRLRRDRRRIAAAGPAAAAVREDHQSRSHLGPNGSNLLQHHARTTPSRPCSAGSRLEDGPIAQGAGDIAAWAAAGCDRVTRPRISGLTAGPPRPPISIFRGCC